MLRPIRTSPSRPSGPIRRAVLAGALALLLAGTVATSAEPPESSEDSSPASLFEERVSVSWVLVPVVVRSGDGYVRGLRRHDFRLWVDGRRVPIEELDLGTDAPLSVVWLQDLSGSMANTGKLGASRRAFETFLAGVRTGDEIALASFAGGRVAVEVPFTGNPDPLREATAVWEGYGTTALHDAVSLLPEISSEGRRGKRVAVLVTDGQDNASGIAPEEALELVRRARLPVYVLGLTADGGRSGDREEEVYRYSDLLRSLAAGTGGRYFELTTASGHGPPPIEETVGHILDDLRQRYILALTTAGDGPESYHRFEVDVVHRGRSTDGATLTFRRGYWGTRPTAWPPEEDGSREVPR